jgi:hypothetical protein
MFDQDDDGPDYEVGYKKPPRQHQFKKGNKAAAGKRGPRHAQGIMAFAHKVMNEKITATVDGKRVRMTRQEALIRSLIYEAKNSSKDTLRLLQLLMDSAKGQMDEVEPAKITVHFVSDRPKGLPGSKE